MGRLAWRHGRSRAPFRPWRAVHRPCVRHRGRGIRHASLGRHGWRLVRQRHGRERRRRVQDRARLAAQALPGFEGPGIGDVPVGLVAGARSVRTGPWATGHRNGPKLGIMQTKRRKPPHYKGGTKIRPYHWSFGRSIALALIFLTMLAAPFTTRASHGERSLTSGGLDTQ